jgi:hypothetical protein
MSWTTRNAARLLLTVLPFAAVAPLSSPRAFAQSDDQARKLQGTWFTQVTARSCTTGAAVRTFVALNTFGAGGTLIDTTTAVSPAVRTPGHGIWEHTGGHTFRAVSLAFLFSAAGAWTGTQRITQTIEMNDGPDGFNSTASSEVFDTAGTQTASTCATAVGQRVE